VYVDDSDDDPDDGEEIPEEPTKLHVIANKRAA
jgi:hypothetical protein